MAEIRLDSQAFFHNIQLLGTRVGRERVAVVLKDNAYGHGLLEMAQLSQRAGIQSAFVKNATEAKLITPYFREVTALYGDIEAQAPDSIHLAVHSLEQIARLPGNRSVELKVDTGMNRNGIALHELPQALELIKNRSLALRGVMAHNGYGDDFGTEFFIQQRRFGEVKNRVKDFVKTHGLPMPRFHSLSSSGGWRAKENDDDLVRFGIAIYGYLCADSSLIGEVDLRPVLSLWGHKITTKRLPQGSRIGYGGMSVLATEASISTYDVGYGDGFYRLNERHTLTTPTGEPILPRVSMDCMSILSEREELCLMNNAREIATMFETIPYEVLTRLSPSLKRVIL